VQETIRQLRKDFAATITQLTARLDDQASPKSKKVRTQLEVSKPAPQAVSLRARGGLGCEAPGRVCKGVRLRGHRLYRFNFFALDLLCFRG
jgi:hypothetical protein